MKFLVSSINFHPDHSGIALYATDLPVFLAEAGHDVTMVTGFPYYPGWKKVPEDKGTLFRTSKYKDVKILRGYLYVPSRVTTLKRLLHDLSFICFAFLNFCQAPRSDVIIIITPPFLLATIGWLFKKFWGAKLVIHIQDFQLDAALMLGMLKKNAFTKLLAGIDKFLYKKADLVVPITQGMEKVILAKGVAENKSAVVYNWIDVKETKGLGKKGVFIQAYPELADKFLIAYAGNIGVKQGLDILVDLAEATQHIENIHYFIIGDGADKTRIMEMAKQKQLKNLTFHPFLDQWHYFSMLNDIDVSFIAQKSTAENVFFPSKILGIMAQGKPILVTADLDSELFQFVKNNHCGMVAPLGDLPTLQRCVEFLSFNERERVKMGKQCLNAVKKFDRQIVLKSYLHELLNIS